MAKQYKKQDWDSDPDFADYKNNLFKDKGNFKRCYETHPALKIGEYQIEGGSCSYPMAKDADVYIGFDWTMKLTPPPFPWQEAKPPKHTEILFRITDGGVPVDVANFKKLVEWTAAQLIAGRKVHAGCIGGHGRTGLFFAALVTYMTGNKDSIQYVRDAYCTKAVETKEQVNFLVKHYGITPREGAKEHLKKDAKVYDAPFTGSSKTTFGGGSGISVPTSHGSKKTISPVASAKNVFKAPRVAG